MMMNAAGRLRIGSALNIPANLPNNRIEITSSPGANAGLNDPYFGNPNNWGASGLRFTNLTSANVGIPNGINGITNTKVLTVDQNGDVVLVPAPASVPTANQGLIVGPGNNVQLGNVCGTPAQMNGNRAINMNNGTFVWGNGRVGFGTANLCAVGNRVEITGLAANQSGLRLTNMTTTTSTIPNPGLGVLSVDGNGDVIYVPDAMTNIVGNNGISYNNGVVQLGVSCNASPQAKNQNAINVNRVIKLNADFVFGDGGNFGVGFPMAGPGMNCNVANKVEIASTQGNPYQPNPVPGANGASGLRLRNLTSAATPLPNGTNGLNATKVLSVDGNGDVVLTTAIGLVGPPGPPGPPGTGALANNGLSLNGNIVVLGGPAGGAGAATLLNNREIPMNGQFIQFSGNGDIGIGGASGAPANKVFIQDNQNTQRGVKIFNSNTGTSAESDVMFQNDINNSAYIGLGSSAHSTFPNKLAVISPFSNIHVEAQNGNHIELIRNGNSHVLIGGVIPAQSLPGVSSQYSSIISDGFLLDGASISSLPQFVIRDYNGTSYNNISFLGDGSNFGSGDLILYNPALPAPYQVLIRANNGAGNALANIGTTNSLGMLNVGGSVYSGGVQLTSDSTLKTNIQSLSASWATQKIKAIRPISYQWAAPKDSLQYGTKYGFTAQQVQTAVPALVSTDSSGKKSLDYNGIIAILTKALQNEIRANEKQDSLIQVLTQAQQACCNNQNSRAIGSNTTNSGNNNSMNQLDVELSDKDVIVLNQNVPNPFAEHCVITYNVPENYNFAQIIFKTSDGKIIKAVNIDKKGKGQLNVFASDLSHGMYIYTLIVDGKVFDSKTMVKE
jgi:hypothetical protein